MRATILDIARETGVSRTTVSNILNGKFKCSLETKERVLQASHRLDYRPNLAAKTLVGQRSEMVGLVFPSYVDGQLLSQSPFYNILINALSSQFSEISHCDLLLKAVGPARGAPARGSPALRDWVLSRNLDGLIFVGDWGPEELKGLPEIPCVFIDNYLSPGRGHRVNIDDQGGARMASAHLLAKGFKRPAFCCTSVQGSAVNAARLWGYMDAVSAAGIKPLLLEPDSLSFEGGRRVAKALAQSPADSVFAVNDILALGILRGLLDLGLNLPQDMGLIGFDDLDGAAQCQPPLSTINQDIFGKGAIAAQSLCRLMAGEELPPQSILPLRLRERMSSQKIQA